MRWLVKLRVPINGNEKELATRIAAIAKLIRGTLSRAFNVTITYDDVFA
jgi:hypothetical protein